MLWWRERCWWRRLLASLDTALNCNSEARAIHMTDGYSSELWLFALRITH